MNIVLIGLRGVGKTSVGRTLAARLGRVFVDTDAHVTRAAGKTIAQIFAAGGETEFRVRETAAIAECMSQYRDAVIAVGGGALLSGENRSILLHGTRVFWLTAPNDILAERVAADAETAATRPTLAGDAASQQSARIASYQQMAATVIDTNSREIDDVARMIADCL